MATDVLPGEPPVEESRDWNVILGITPPPYPERPEVDPYGGMRLSSYENIPLEDAMSFMRQAESMRRQQIEARAAAIRYEGQVDYERLIKAGTTPDEALRQAGPKMFFRHPEGLTASISRMAPQRKVEPSVRTILDEGGIPAYDQITDSLGRVHVVRYPEGPVGKAKTGTSSDKLTPNTLASIARLLPPDSAEQKAVIGTILEMIPSTKSLIDKQELEDYLYDTSPPEEGGAPYKGKGILDWIRDKLPSNLPIKGGHIEDKEGLLPGATAPAHIPPTMDQQAAALGMTNAPVPSLSFEPLGPPPPPTEARPVVPTGVSPTNVAPSNAPPILSPEDERRLFLMTNRTAKATAPGQRVRVKAPNGKIGTIPIEQLEEALKQGYERL